MYFLDLVFYSVCIFFVCSLGKLIVAKSIGKLKDEKISYRSYVVWRFCLNLFMVLVLAIIWSGLLKNVLVPFSILAGVGIFVCKDFIVNGLCAEYIKETGLVKVGDVICVDGIVGEVMRILPKTCELCEISSKDRLGQKSGIVVEVPHSSLFLKGFKNYTKNQEFVWDEIEVFVPLDANLVETKKTLVKIVHDVDIIKNVIKKMENKVLDRKDYMPSVYVQLNRDYVTFYVRFLVSPKKSGYMKSILSNRVYEAYMNGEIALYKKDINFH